MSPSVSKNTFHQITTSDTVAPTISSLFIPHSFHQALAADTWAISLSSPTFVGNGTITIQTKSSSLVPGATYRISPNPLTGSGTLTIVDGGLGDLDGVNNGIVKVANVPTGTYNITQTVTPAGFTSLLKSTIATVAPTQMDPTIIFQVTSSATNLSQLPPTSITAPSLSSATLNTWITSFSATIVNGSTSTTVTNVNQLPQIIIAGKSNATAISTAVNSQSSVLLSTSFPPLTSGLTVISTIGLPNYTLPNSTAVVAVIPTTITTVNSTSGQIVATPPLVRIIPGQQMIIPAADSSIPSFGGLKKIDLRSSPTATSTGGTAPDEWFVAQVDNKLPSSIPSSGIQGSLVLFINLQHPFEQTGIGFNWADPATFAVSPTLTLVVNKTSDISIQKDSSGCPVVQAYTLSSGTWTTNGLSEISSTSISASKCQVKIQSQHLSKFAFSLAHLSSLSSSVGLSGQGAVSAGTLGGGSGTAQEASAQTGPITQTGVLGQNSKLKIYEVSYDVCNKKMVRIVVDANGQETPKVVLRTSSSNQGWAKLSADQSLNTQSSNSNMSRYVFDTPIEPNYKSFEIIALIKIGNNVYSSGKRIEMTGCQETLTFGTSGKYLFSDTSTASPFPLIKTMPIKDLIRIEVINDQNGRTIADPFLLYSSFKHNDKLMYKVTAPDGTCVIGTFENCLVTQSTQLMPEHVKNVTVGGQEYKIRYLGPDDPLERFSISSANPIVGQWKVEIDSQNRGTLDLSAMQQAFLKIRYESTN
ncbi:MAG TPA: hypothetical protein VGR54_01930 [Nitrosopumilaceae archaeon]|nr:hypothetical protein [Nitrosopumilaceae archaeon]